MNKKEKNNEFFQIPFIIFPYHFLADSPENIKRNNGKRKAK